MFSWSHLGLVALGGAIGTALRAALTLAFSDARGLWLVPLVDVAGSFALGALMGALSRRRPGPRVQAAQMLLGSGVLGGFTTYSALAVQAAGATDIVWGLVTVLAGIAAAWAGLTLGRGRASAPGGSEDRS